MECYEKAISAFVTSKTGSWSENEWMEVTNELDKWIVAPDKHNFTKFFDNPKNRLSYTKRLYESRARCFLAILKQTTSIDEIRETMENRGSIVSFGCGPGPEIAAYLCYVRNELKCKDLHLNIVGVDILSGWGPFIKKVKKIDKHATVTFQSGKLNKKYLRKMGHCDVCIMSYPHAMNFEDIWASLTRKFTVIIFIDQDKESIRKKATSNGFQMEYFLFNGEKIFFYYIDKDYYNKERVTEEKKVKKFKCPRNGHDMNKEFGTCNAKLNQNLDCGHTITIPCYKSGGRIVCDEPVKIMCQRNIHELETICGVTFIKCKVWIDIVLKCGHVSRIFCCENEEEVAQRIKCKEMDNACQRNEQSSFAFFGSNEICEDIAKVILQCGHLRDIVGGDVFQESDACMENVMKVCGRGLHKHMLPCSSTIRCEDNIKYKLVCGHEHVMKCHENIPLLVKTSDYSNIINNGHMTEIELNIIRERGSNDDDDESLYLGSVDNNDDSKKCKERCDKVLNCGHRCMWSCHACVNGRLHRRCLEYCPRILKCGHRCTDKCHDGKCKNCPKRCMINSLSNVIPINYEDCWTKSLLSRNIKLPSELETLLSDSLTRLGQQRFSNDELMYYEESFQYLTKLLDLYEVLIDEIFPITLKIYIDDVKESILWMIRLICNVECGVIKNNLDDFHLEFERIDCVVNICRIVESFMDDNSSVFNTLNKITLTPFTKDIRDEILQQITNMSS